MRPLSTDKTTGGLDAAQREAALTTAEKALVIAGPGSGKTRVLTSRYARLVSAGADPAGLSALTFTNRAAAEMKRRVARLSGLEPGRVNAGTFHAFSLKLLKGAGREFALYGRGDSVRLLRELGVDKPERAASAVSAYKNSGAFLAGGIDGPGHFDRYQEALRARGALDLDDLVPEAVRLIEEDAAPSTPSHVLVDELQDINPPQARLLALLGAKATVFAIGDPDQAIYAFRGSSQRAFEEFGALPGVAVYRLERNYRSASAIVRASGAVIEKNPGRLGCAMSPEVEGGVIRSVECADEAHEAAFIVREIESAMGGLSSLTVGGDGREGMRFSDFAVLFRTRRQAEALMEAFGSSSIPFKSLSAPDASFRALMERIRELVSTGEKTGLADAIDAAAQELGTDAEVAELFRRTCRGLSSSSLEEFASMMLLFSPDDSLDVEADKVALLTLHAAKGLEFRTVFIAGMEEGLIPIASSGDDVEEERRLFYVGMTRAGEELVLTRASSRRAWGAPRRAERSRFLGEIPPELVRCSGVAKKKRARRPVQKGLFE